jgi:Flp pilus assembly protein TadG
MNDERGQVTAFVASVMVALLVLAGLTVDGGYALAARRRAVDEANGAARAGAQALALADYRATGTYRLNPAAATAAARAYLAPTGHDATVTVAGDRIRVEVRFSQPMVLLRIVGVDRLAVSGKGEARSVRGVRSAES